MNVQNHGTLYDVYVKNDTYYAKFPKLLDNVYDENDKAFYDYEEAVKKAIPELANLSDGDVSIHVLPENNSDKSSSQSDDVSDDIIGITQTAYTYEGTSESPSENFSITFTPDKSSIKTVLDRINTLYKNDATLNKTVTTYSNPENYVDDFAKASVDENGEKIVTLTAVENPLAYAIASMNSDLTDNSMNDIVDRKFFINSTSTEEKMKQLAKTLQEEQDALLLGTNDTPQTSSQESDI